MIKLKNLKQALDSEPSPPCVKYACSSRDECSEKLLSCSAFRIYAETGKVLSPLYIYQDRKKAGVEATYAGVPTPTREAYRAQQIDHERTDEKRTELIEDAIKGGVASIPELQRVWS